MTDFYSRPQEKIPINVSLKQLPQSRVVNSSIEDVFSRVKNKQGLQPGEDKKRICVANGVFYELFRQEQFPMYFNGPKPTHFVARMYRRVMDSDVSDELAKVWGTTERVCLLEHQVLEHARAYEQRNISLQKLVNCLHQYAQRKELPYCPLQKAA